MNIKKTVILAGTAVLIVLILAVCLIIALNPKTQDVLESELMVRGRRYLSNGEYENAVIVLQEALEDNPNDSEIYLMLSNAYASMGKEDEAMRVLARGYDITGDLTLRKRLLELDPDLKSHLAVNPLPVATKATEEVQEPTNSVEPVLNRGLISFLATATLNDYRNAYGGVSLQMEQDSCLVRVSGLNAVLKYYNTGTRIAIDPRTGEPSPELVPNEIILDDISDIFGGAELIREEDLIRFHLEGVQIRDQIARFSLFSCEFTINCDEDGVIHSGAENCLIPELRYQEIAVEYHVRGAVLDAATGAPVTDVMISGFNRDTGETVSAETDYDGVYDLTFNDGGTILLQITAPGYISEEQVIEMDEDGFDMELNLTLSHALEEGQIRFVLTWGEYPSDLDSHLIGTTGSGQSVHVFFGDKIAANGALMLDVDDTSSYGPETTTINDTSGSYEFIVQDYTLSNNISESGAQVKIYQGDQLVEVVSVPAGLENQWSVCRIENGTITITNTASNRNIRTGS